MFSNVNTAAKLRAMVDDLMRGLPSDPNSNSNHSNTVPDLAMVSWMVPGARCLVQKEISAGSDRLQVITPSPFLLLMTSSLITYDDVIV